MHRVCSAVALSVFAVAIAAAQNPCPNAKPVPPQFKAPPAQPPGEKFAFEKQLLAYLSTYDYQNLGWCVDKSVRDTGPWINSVYYGTHLAVRIYYSPEVMEWLRRGRQGRIPDGAVILKEHYKPPAARWDGTTRPTDWTFMIRNSGASKDGWFWGEVWQGMPTDTALQYPNTGYGLYCLRCHASAETEYTFSALNNIAGFPGEPIVFRVDDSWRPAPATAAAAAEPPVHSRLEFAEHEKNELLRLRDAEAPKIHTLEAAARNFLRFFALPSAGAEAQPLRFPPASLDHYISSADGPGQFLTSDQCQSCHSGAAPGAFGPNMYLVNGGTASGEGINVSPYGEWRWSPMGLAGRDPNFFAQLESELAHIDTMPNAATLRQQTVNTCMLCHGVMGKRTYDIDHNCRDSLNCAGFSPDFVFQPYERDPKNFRYGSLARDGISCTVCHHIADQPAYGKPDDLNRFLEHSINGQYEVSKPDQLYGPFDDVATYPMENALGIKPQASKYLQSSRMCGSCHTINLPVIDQAPLHPIDANSRYEIEQATYLEWINSQYQDEFQPVGSAARSCQDCHMPGGYANRARNISVPQIQARIAVVQDNSYPQSEHHAPAEKLEVKYRTTGYRRHELLGANAFLLEMMNQFAPIMGLWTGDYMSGSKTDLPNAIDNVVEQAQTATARVTVESSAADGVLTADVRVANLTGHRFPSGVGFRRAFLEVLVEQGQGATAKTIWSSGRTNAEGVILGPDDQPLPSESFAAGADGGQQYQEHYNQDFPITRQDQVQIYEELVQDAEGKFTTSFLRRDHEVKDNRLLPAGWTKEGPDPSLKPFFLHATYPKGRAATDRVYLSGKGVSVVRYQIPLPAGVDPKSVRVQVTLYYQSIPPYFLQDRFRAGGPQSQRLEYLAGHLDLSNTPLRNWKLKIASASAGPSTP